MILIRRYLWNAVLLPSLAVLAVLLALDGLFSFIDQLGRLRADYQVMQAMQYVVTTMPRTAHEFLPMAVLLGTLLGLGVLANSGELTIIRGSGTSPRRISWLVMRPAVVLLLIGMAVGEYVVPWSERIAQSNRAIAERGEDITYRSRSGFWHREGNEFIHINAVQSNGVLHGVTRYRFHENRTLAETQFIGRAIYQDESWFTEDIFGTTLLEERTVPYRQDTGVWESELTPELLSIIVLSPENLALTKIWGYAHYLQRQGLEAGEYLLSFWQKLFMPFATLGMVLIAISFIFGPLREVSMGLRLTTGIIAGMVFHYGQQFIGHVSLIFQMPPLLAAAVPAAVCLTVGIWLLGRIR